MAMGLLAAVMRAMLMIAPALLAGGCWWHASRVPALEPGEIPARKVLRSGVYCLVESDKAAAAAGLAVDAGQCMRVAWDRSERRHRVTAAGEAG
ncbi:MAG: hypothetical protein MI723_13065, partial [Caulobacterales bacterium]|nr:hypothetical protein [Caulobacterales bacterium]